MNEHGTNRIAIAGTLVICLFCFALMHANRLRLRPTFVAPVRALPAGRPDANVVRRLRHGRVHIAQGAQRGCQRNAARLQSQLDASLPLSDARPRLGVQQLAGAGPSRFHDGGGNIVDIDARGVVNPNAGRNNIPTVVISSLLVFVDTAVLLFGSSSSLFGCKLENRLDPRCGASFCIKQLCADSFIDSHSFIKRTPPISTSPPLLHWG